MDRPANTTAEFEVFLRRFKDAQPVDMHQYKQDYAFALEEIEKDWSNSGHHDVAGSYHVLMDKFFDENPGYKDSDGDITEDGYAALDKYTKPIKEAAAREMVGEPTKPDLSMVNPEHAAKVVHAYLEEAGLEVSPIGGSGKSASRYFEVLAGDGERKKIRVADHPLPVEYLDANGASDYELSLYDLTMDVRYDGRDQSTGLDEETAISRIVDLVERVKGDAQLHLTKISFDPSGVALPDFAGCYEKVGNCYRREDTGREFSVENGTIRLPIDATKADISAAASLLEIAGIKDVSISGELADKAWQEISSRGIESAGREAPRETRKEKLPALDQVVEVEKRQLTECDEQVACR